MPNDNSSIEVARAPAEMATLESLWRGVFQASPSPSPFSSFAWVKSWLKVFGEKVNPHVLLYKERGKTLAILPLRRSSYSPLPGIRLNKLEFLQSCKQTCPDHLGWLGAPEAVSRATPVAVSLLLNDPSWQMMDLKEWSDRDRGQEDFLKILRESGLQASRDAYGRILSLPLSQSWEEYLKGMSGNGRKSLKKILNKFQKFPDMEWHCLESPDGIAATLDEFVRLHEERWHKSSSFAGDRSKTFQRTFLHELAQQGRNPEVNPRLYCLRQNGELIGALYGFLVQGIVYLYQSARKTAPEWTGAGQVIMARAIQDAIDAKWREINFLRGDESYKSYWTRNPRFDYRILANRKNLLPSVIHHGVRLKRRLSRMRSFHPEISKPR